MTKKMNGGKKGRTAGRRRTVKVARRSARKTAGKPSGGKARAVRRTRKKTSAASARAASRRRGSPAAKKTAPAKRATKRSARKRSASIRGFRRRVVDSSEATRGLGPDAGGQSGDTEGLSRSEIADSESVEELLEEGQAFEAGIVSGVERALDADEREVETRQVPEDDVPPEYFDRD
jgi:hypothetical protein